MIFLRVSDPSGRRPGGRKNPPVSRSDQGRRPNPSELQELLAKQIFARMIISNMKYIIGIDEVGRGALAGPVVVTAVSLPRGFRVRNTALGQLKDSKKLSKGQRERWCDYFLHHPGVGYASAKVYPRTIERINISEAANLAAERALLRLVKSHAITLSRSRVFLDGGLYVGRRNRRAQIPFLDAKTVVKGDEKIKAVQIASVIAKVYRDRLMKRLSKEYPTYGFDIHKGYGTKNHRLAIKKHGLREVHR